MKTNILSSSVAVILLSGCAAQEPLMVTGGSRADGTIIMATSEHSSLEKPILDLRTAETQAQRRCAAWGYAGAEPFDNLKSVCTNRGGFGNCLNQFERISYQCINPSAATTK